MGKKQFILIAANLIFVAYASKGTLDTHSSKFDSMVIALYDFAQSHPDVVQLSDEFIALYQNFLNHNCELSVEDYMKFRMEAHAYNKLIAQKANAQSFSQEFIDLHS